MTQFKPVAVNSIITLTVSINEDQPIELDLDASSVIDDLSKLFLFKLEQRSDKISYQFFLDEDYLIQLNSSQTITQACLTNDERLYGRGVYASIKIRIFKNEEEINSIDMTIDKCVNDIIQLLKSQQNHWVETYEKVSIMTSNDQNRQLTDYVSPLWQQQIYDSLSLRFMVLEDHQRKYNGQIVSILNKGQTVTYYDQTNSIEATFDRQSVISTPFTIQESQFEAEVGEFKYDNTTVIFYKKQSGIFISWTKPDVNVKFCSLNF